MNDDYKKWLDQWEMAKQNYTGPFCCLEMNSMIDNDDGLYNLRYSLKAREYYLESLPGPYIRTIEFCPWCGTRLPKSLGDEWLNVLEKEYGLDMPDLPEQETKIPADFLTDEWWKKRGL